MSDFPEEYRDGYVLFFGQRIAVDQRALIPRIETEELIKYALRLLTQHPEINTIVDIGTGSGVIPLSLNVKSPRKLTIIATDMSQDALDLARENTINKDILLLQGDLLDPVIRYFGDTVPENVIITANLPYVLTREVV